MSQPSSNEDVAKALQRAIRQTSRSAQLTASVFASATQWPQQQQQGVGTYGSGALSGAEDLCELIASRTRILSQEVDIFAALAKEGDARLQQGLFDAVQWGLLHLTDRAQWPERRRILSRRTADGDGGTVGAPGQQQERQQQGGAGGAGSLLTLAEIPAPDAIWDKAMCARVAGMTTVDLAVSDSAPRPYTKYFPSGLLCPRPSRGGHDDSGPGGEGYKGGRECCTRAALFPPLPLSHPRFLTPLPPVPPVPRPYTRRCCASSP